MRSKHGSIQNQLICWNQINQWIERTGRSTFKIDDRAAGQDSEEVDEDGKGESLDCQTCWSAIS